MKEITLKVNGIVRSVQVEDNEILLDTLRNKLGVTSVKAACWRGECGLCTVLLDGVPVKSCMVLSAEVDGSEIITAEGLLQDERAKGLMSSFVEKGAMQCGFCTPAFVVTSHYLLLKNPSLTDEEIKEGLKGIICRCGSYLQIRSAVKEAKKFYTNGKKSFS